MSGAPSPHTKLSSVLFPAGPEATSRRVVSDAACAVTVAVRVAIKVAEAVPSAPVVTSGVMTPTSDENVTATFASGTP